MEVQNAGIIFIYLGVLSVWDYRERQVPTVFVAAGGLLLPCMGVARTIQGQLSWMEFLAGALPGAILLLVAWITKKAGVADGIVLIELGLCVGYRQSILIFCLSMLLAALVSVGLLTLKKVHRNTRLPYLPFLFFVYIVQEISWVSG